MDMTHIARRMPQKYSSKGDQGSAYDMNSGCGWICLRGVVNSESWLPEGHPPSNNHLEEAMALLILNQAAFVEQIARNDQERLALQRTSEDWQRKSDARFEKIEERLMKIEASLVQLPKTILRTLLEQLPKAVKKEIGFKSRT